MYDKMTFFLPPTTGSSLGGEFECWYPDEGHSKSESVGNVAWKGGALEAIKADAALPFVNLPKQLEDMIKYCWEKASVSGGAVRGNIQIGAQRRVQSGSPQAIMARAVRGQYNPMVSPTTPPPAPPGSMPHLQGVANDWKLMEELERINAYTFRGDTRTPDAIKAAGGFNPPSTRNDDHYVENGFYPQFASYMQRQFHKTIDKQTFLDAYKRTVVTEDAKKVMFNFSIWRALADAESLHIGRMLANEALKGYISTTRAVSVAKGFAKSGGWVFLTLIKGGFVVPDRGNHDWTAIFGEQEIALPVALPWADIMGFRQVAATGPYKFDGPLYFRKGFEGTNRAAFQQAHDLLSGKAQ